METSGPLEKALEELLGRNFSTYYTSCIKINGRPILPPVMSEERRVEMRHLRDMAVKVESKIINKKGGDLHDDAAGGEAMYEEAIEELHFANSLPTSLVPPSDEYARSLPQQTEPSLADQVSREHEKQLSSIQATNDMLREFDPLAEESNSKSNSVYSSDANLNDGSLERAISKPSSAESSVALSCSTDLNNYMDITESSADMSVPHPKSIDSDGTGATTPSTVRPDSAATSQLNAQWKDGKTTYEELNNYLDSLLNNSISSKSAKLSKDSNQNVVTSSISPLSSQRTVTPPSLPESFNPISANPPPLTSPKGCLQTRIVIDSHRQTTPTRDKNPMENSSNFLQDCALSPVVRGEVQNSYEQKVQLYLQNLMIDEVFSRDLSNLKPSSNPSNLTENCQQPFSPRSSVADDPQKDSGISVNGSSQPLPRLVRSNSYTLDTPSPMLLAHMEAELQKNVRNDTCPGDEANVGPSRRVWDAPTAKNMPSWSMRQNNSTNSNTQVQSPKKVHNRKVFSQPNSLAGLDCLEASVSSKQINSQVASNQWRPKKPVLGQTHKKFVDSSQGDSQSRSTVNQQFSPDDSECKVRSLLLQLQLQHNQEMEELLNRQRKEKEAIRLALLEEQQENSDNLFEENDPSRLQASSKSHLNQSQSPPTKDKSHLMERRNTSPSMTGKDNSTRCLPVLSSAMSLDNVSTSNNCLTLIDLDNEKEFESQSTASANGKDLEKTGGLAIGNYKRRSTVNQDTDCLTSDMISSFPPSELLTSTEMDSMTSSLPPEILSLHFFNSEMTYKNANSISCKTRSSSISINKSMTVSADAVSQAQNMLSSAVAPIVAGGSPHSKRRSWCSRQLFPDTRGPDWISQFQQIREHQAAARIQAGVRGYLTRRLLKTERVQNCITTIRDTVVCALQLQRECAPNVEPSDLQLHGRLIQQLTAACEELHHIFVGLPMVKRMSIITADRERLRSRTPRSQSSTGSRPLSRATQIVLQRKMNQTDPGDSSSVRSRASSASRSRRRSWATVESRSKPSTMSATMANNCEVIPGCLSRSSGPTSLPLQRSASAGSSRRPWR